MAVEIIPTSFAKPRPQFSTGPSDLCLLTHVTAERDGYGVGYSNDAGTQYLSWLSLERHDGTRAAWAPARATSGTVKLEAEPQPRDVIRFWVRKPGTCGDSWNVMSSWANDDDAIDAVPSVGVVGGVEFPDPAPYHLSMVWPLEVSHVNTIDSWPHWRITSAELRINKWIVSYERDLGPLPNDHCYVALYNSRGERLAWDWATGRAGVAAVPHVRGGAYLIYNASHVVADAYDTRVPVFRWYV